MRIDQANYLILDTETTGLIPETDKVVEVAAVYCTPTMIVAEKIWSRLFNPGIPIPASASAIHHLTDEDVHGHFVYEPSYIDESDVLVAHNAEFDKSFLRVKSDFICTMRLAQKLWPDLESYSNQFLRYHLKLNPPVNKHAQFHRALPDALVTATLLIAELAEVLGRADEANVSPMSVEDLIKWINEPMLLTTVRFGKHKDSKWADVPKDYLRWILDKMTDASVDVIFTARHYLGK